MTSEPVSKDTESHHQQLSRLQTEVDALREQLNRAQRLATVGTMTAMVAHEFNNILTPIVNYARMARKDPALVEKALDRVASGGMRASDICHALLDVTRQGGQPRTCDLAQLVKDTLDAMAREPAKDGIDLKLNLPDGLKVTTRSAELQQVLLNLLINARTALLASTGLRRLDISADRSCTHVAIRVADTGVGIPPENLTRIFEPFFTTKESAADGTGGHGLGLAFCREAMKTLGGDISVESTPGHGSTFTLRLPA